MSELIYWYPCIPEYYSSIHG